MKYFSPSYWFKLWVLSAPLFNDKTQGINAKSIDNKNIKDWVSNNTSLESIENQKLNLTNNTISNSTNIDIDHFYENFLKTQGWSKDPQIAQQQLIEIQEEHHHFLEAQHKKSRKRIKRTKNIGVNGDNEIEFSGHFMGISGTIYLSFKPDFWEEIVQIKMKNIDKDQFSKEFKDKMFTGVWKDYRVDNDNSMRELGEVIYDNFWTIANKFIDSSREKRIKIEIKLEKNGWTKVFTYSYISTDIRTDDTRQYSNWYLNILKRDFPIWNSEETFNLGIINNDNDNDFKNSIKQKYSKLEIQKISIVDKEEYSHFCQCFKAKLYVSRANSYSFGNLRPTFSYITQTKLNEISNIIFNDKDVKQWIKDINEWNSTLPQAIENAKTFTPELLYNWKRQEKETIKNYLARWDTTVRIINNELKLDELNKNVQGLKSTFDMIKNQVNELDTKITNLENQSNANCANIATISAGVISVIPVIGNVGGAIATATAGACAIAGV